MLFQYAQLARDSIRLIKIDPSSSAVDIHLTLSHQNRYFEKPARYTAIWYPAATPDAERKPVTLNGRTRTLPLEAWNVLSAICEHHDRDDSYWIDAVCINQQDEAEKRFHLQQLENIFSSANKVILWLGASDQAVESAFPALDGRAEPTIEVADAARSIAKRESFIEALRKPELQQVDAVMMSGRSTCRLGAFKDFLQKGPSSSQSVPTHGRQSAGSL
ncbi:hypothetical protein PRZ48_015010 [Zasmidium cellare]|uniref:Heterokaryon incompatibility domain-containing protein n=1 Tax=Zasmidium cellare TaxID=395010 RepID=A0ABR0DXV3_ZASCE|nr:hypothetical protein PRZ48_015010 [Zasmidium cellare]